MNFFVLTVWNDSKIVCRIGWSTLEQEDNYFGSAELGAYPLPMELTIVHVRFRVGTFGEDWRRLVFCTQK